MKEIIVRTYPPFKNGRITSYYDNRDSSVTGSTGVFESITIQEGKITSCCKLVGYDIAQYIDSIVIVKEEDKHKITFRAATIKEVNETIKVVKESLYHTNRLKHSINELQKQSIKDNRGERLNNILESI